jgi:hypothetical protein
MVSVPVEKDEQDDAMCIAATRANTVSAGIVSAPLWDSKSSTFAGLLTTSDYINVIQYYWQNNDALARVDQFRLNSLRGKQLAEVLIV